jgi:hypothetical protein
MSQAVQSKKYWFSLIVKERREMDNKNPGIRSHHKAYSADKRTRPHQINDRI